MRAALLALLVALAAGGCSPAPVEVATLGQDALASGLIAHWAFEEGGGASISDGSGNGHNGVLEGPGWTWIDGRFGSAVHLSGPDLVSVSGFPRATPSYTVSAWVFVASSELGPPIANLLSTEVLGGGWALYATLGIGYESYSFRYAASGPQGFWSATCDCLTPDSWTHLTAVVDGAAGTLTLYVGSAPPVTVPAPAEILPGSTTLNIGRSTLQQPGAAFPLTGALDDIAIYSRALAPEEVARLAQGPAPDPN
jgi:hypothetical protein